MSAWIIPPVAGLIEPAVAPEFQVDGIGAIEVVGADIRMYLMAEQLPLENGMGRTHCVVVAKLRGPMSNVPVVIGQMAQCLWRSPNIQPSGPRLVR